MDIFDKRIVAKTRLTPGDTTEIELDCGHRQTMHSQIADVLRTSYCGACVTMYINSAKSYSKELPPELARSAGK